MAEMEEETCKTTVEEEEGGEGLEKRSLPEHILGVACHEETECDGSSNGGQLPTVELQVEDVDDEDENSSLELERVMGGVKERASSSLSISSRGSRIPRPSQNNSQKERPHRLSLDGRNDLRVSNEQKQFSIQKSNKMGGLFRSSSFVTSRDMKDTPPYGSGGFTAPSTPELKIKRRSYVSPYSKKAIASERKIQFNVAPSRGRDREVHQYFSPQISRGRTSSACGSYNQPKGDTSPEGEDEDDDEDASSEKSFGSICSTHSCDRGRYGAGFWSFDRRSRNILHCSHAYDHDPKDYLTPTQRAAKKIRELQAQLKKARREISEKDSKIAVLTRQLVQIHMNKTESHETDKFETEAQVEYGSGGGGEAKKNKENCSRNSSQRRSPSGSDLLSSSLTSYPEQRQTEIKLSSGDKTFSDTREPLSRSSRSSPGVASVGEDSDSGELSRSLADSGHYDDLPSPCLSSRVSHYEETLEGGIPVLRKIVSSICASEGERDTSMIWAAVTAAEEGIKSDWARKVEELKANHMEEYHEMKERHNDKVEMLLSKLSDSNLKYFELRPQFDKGQERIRCLEKEVEKLEDSLRESEMRHQKVYLQMYLKGQEAAKLNDEKNFDNVDYGKEERRKFSSSDAALSVDAQSTVVMTLMKQLAQSEDQIEQLKMARSCEKVVTRNGRGHKYDSRREEIDPEITLQFLKSAIYYFLTDKDNAQGHLRAIESILGYSSVERGKISRSCRI